MAGKAVTIYIRADNLDKWAEIEHKSDYVNDCLSGAEDGFERKVKRVLREVLPEMIRELQGL